MSDSIERSRGDLRSNFCVDNLKRVYREYRIKISTDNQQSAALFLCSVIAIDLANWLEDQSVTVDEANDIKNMILPAFDGLLESIENTANKNELIDRMNELVRAYLKIRPI